MNWYHDGYGWMDGGSLLMMGLFWFVMIGFGIWLVTLVGRRDKAPKSTQETPKQILDRRLASGEIDADAYAKARKLIDGSSTTPGEPTDS